MKKLTSLLVVVALALGMMAFAGCWFEAQSISFVEAPATTFTVGENVLDFTIRVNEGGSTKDYRYSEYKGLITVSGFNTDTIGSRRATVTYNNQFSLRFDYTVVNGNFAGGTGSEFDPYLVSTVGQFQNLLNEKAFHYYKLTNSIDFKGQKLNQANKGDKATDSEVWTGYIDGAGYSLLNLTECGALDSAGNYVAKNKYNEMFGRVGKFVMKNITVNFSATGASALPGIAFANSTGAEILFENVSVTGYIDASYSNNSALSPFVNFVNRSVAITNGTPTASSRAIKSLTFKNCTNSLRILNSYSSDFVGGYVATTAPFVPGTLKFENCSYDGIIEGNGQFGAAAFLMTQSAISDADAMFTGCSILANAKLIKTVNAHYGAVYYNGVTADPAGITGSDREGLIKDDLGTLTVNVDANKVLTVSGSSDIKSYKVFSYGSMTYTDNNGGGFRCVQPAAGSFDGTTYSQQLYTINWKATGTTDNTDTSCGSVLFVKNDTAKTITYYGETTNLKSLGDIKKVVVVGFNDQGVAIAIGIKTSAPNLKGIAA